MTVKVRERKYGNGMMHFEADIHVRLVDGTMHRERRRAPGGSLQAATRWAKELEAWLIRHGPETALEVERGGAARGFAVRSALEAEHGAPVLVVGDVNSTGFLDRDHPERRFIDRALADHDLALPTTDLACSMYWRPRRESERHEVSLLDHVIGPEGLGFGRADVLGMCAALACEPHDGPPPGFDAVSDHCPGRVELRR